MDVATRSIPNTTPIKALASVAKPDEDQQVRKLAEQLVSQTFFGTLMRQMRNSPWKDTVLSGGRGGEAFQQMHDQEMIMRMGRSAGKQLVNALVEQMMGQKARQQRAKDAMKSNKVNPNAAASFTA
jgi:Rod binding domain-containing protein